MLFLKLCFRGHCTAGIDYGQFSDVTIGLVTIVLADELTVVSGVSIFDDSLVEYNENFTVR